MRNKRISISLTPYSFLLSITNLELLTGGIILCVLVYLQKLSRLKTVPR